MSSRAIDNLRGGHIVGDMEIKLCVPPESAALKTEVKHLRGLLSGPGVRWEPLAVWFGNKIPQYLWAHWKDELKPAGFTWQAFLKLLHYRTDGAVLWLDDALSWEGFVEQTIILITGPAGERLVRRKDE